MVYLHLACADMILWHVRMYVCLYVCNVGMRTAELRMMGAAMMTMVKTMMIMGNNYDDTDDAAAVGYEGNPAGTRRLSKVGESMDASTIGSPEKLEMTLAGVDANRRARRQLCAINIPYFCFLAVLLLLHLLLLSYSEPRMEHLSFAFTCLRLDSIPKSCFRTSPVTTPNETQGNASDRQGTREEKKMKAASKARVRILIIETSSSPRRVVGRDQPEAVREPGRGEL
ncbi:hypothetical protein F4859DRAFT_50942 [Xylaria cf. heliscus]|nr:hypothetical protein F4859DRAFT_50942 [Xylaria cf. heliscus]